jgi:hypothetical protein
MPASRYCLTLLFAALVLLSVLHARAEEPQSPGADGVLFLAGAFLEEYQVDRNRETQQEANRPWLNDLLTKERFRTSIRLGGLASSLKGICANLARMESEAGRDAYDAEREWQAMSALASEGRIARVAADCSAVGPSLARIESIRERVAGYADQLRRALDRLDAQCAACAGPEDARQIRSGYESCSGLALGIRQLAAEAAREGEKARLTLAEAERAAADLETARRSRDRIFQLSGRVGVIADAISAELQLADEARARLMSACDASERNIADLRGAFGTLTEDEEERFRELSGLVGRYRTGWCDTGSLRQQFDRAHDKAVYAKLNCENLLRSQEVAAGGLDACGGGFPAAQLADIAAADQDAALAFASHGDLLVKIEDCSRVAAADDAAAPRDDGGGFGSAGGETVQAEPDARQGGFGSAGGETTQAVQDEPGQESLGQEDNGGFAQAGGSDGVQGEVVQRVTPGALPVDLGLLEIMGPSGQPGPGQVPYPGVNPAAMDPADARLRNEEEARRQAEYEQSRQQDEAAERARLEREQAAVNLLNMMSNMQGPVTGYGHVGQPAPAPPVVMPGVSGFSPSQQMMIDRSRPSAGVQAPVGAAPGMPPAGLAQQPARSCEPSIEAMLQRRGWVYIAGRSQPGGPWLERSGRPSVLGRYTEVPCGSLEALIKFRCELTGEVRCLK